MKKTIRTVLLGALCLSMLPLSIYAAETPSTPKITVDGDISDWEGVHSIGVVGTDDYEGKKVTFYGLLTDAGLYLACDAYHEFYTTDKGDWFRNSNMEFFIDNSDNAGNYQGYVSAKNKSAMDSAPSKDGGALSHPSQMTEKGQVAMVTEEINQGAAKFHTVTELYLPNDFHFDNNKPETAISSLAADGVIRVGIAWKTGHDANSENMDRINNAGEANTTWWFPVGSWPGDNAKGEKTVVTANGIYIKADYDALPEGGEATTTTTEAAATTTEAAATTTEAAATTTEAAATTAASGKGETTTAAPVTTAPATTASAATTTVAGKGETPTTTNTPNPGNPGGSPATGTAAVVIAAVAAISLAGVVIAAKKREQD